MKKILQIIGFKSNANLLDSKMYIVKAFLAIATAYGFGIKTDLVKLDMISVLFGTMLTLEPVTITGIKNAWNQITATLLGVISTFIIISIFGINIITVATVVAITLYIGLKINWREVPVVSFFTAIYMTQYVQLGPLGEPSMWLTAKLRLMALIYGVLIAIVYNFLFSFVSYKQMPNKRLKWILDSLGKVTVKIEHGLREKNINDIKNINKLLPNIAKDIDWVYRLFEDTERENNLKKKYLTIEKSIQKEINILFEIKSICHSLYDFGHYIERKENQIMKNNDNILIFENELVKISNRIELISQKLDENSSLVVKNSRNFDIVKTENNDISIMRLEGNIAEINYCLDTIEDFLYLNNKFK